MTFVCVIPAREKSKRFPGKLLKPLMGKPVILHVLEACIKSDAKKVFVATDSENIKRVVSAWAKNIDRKEKVIVEIVRGREIRSGTDRVAKLVRKRVRGADIVVNVQGDEPLITPYIINKVAFSLYSDKNADISTYGFISDDNEAENINRVKIVVDRKSYAIYFSRAKIPFGSSKWIIHSGIYAFRLWTLLKFAKLPPSSNEKSERLEQLRAIDNNMKIKVVIGRRKLISVDTEEDIRKIEDMLRNKMKNKMMRRNKKIKNES